MNELERLTKIADDAERALLLLKRAKTDERDKLESAAMAVINEQMAERHDAGISAANKIFYAAQDELQKERDRVARLGEGGPLPVGSKVVEWVSTNRWGASRPIGTTVGVVECITTDSVHPQNISRWSKAKVGEWVVRHLKKDGTPSARYTTCRGNELPWRWHPEGVDPNKAEA